MTKQINFLGNKAHWHCVDDPVMGGTSWSQVRLNSRNLLIWAGSLSLENGGGFASVSQKLSPAINLKGYQGIHIVVQGESKIYKLNLANDNSPNSPRFQLRFRTVGNEQHFKLAFANLEASIRGRKVNAQFSPSYLSQIGFLIADQQEGPFTLNIKSIQPYD
ncbi:CIA30 family protein [Porifericola rhodea]|uniref:CIA30 family protein n=1 Tax=Porifericola rhodea TaxID=930972 RepID=UPI00266646FC|nr:CIA30 family protein [Porifericola rhodea]WKN33716.1 CIA30 family protein [Porifericola rhodea]